MDSDRFDAFTRFLASRGSRRAALGALLGAGMLRSVLDSVAGKGRGRANGKGRDGGRATGKRNGKASRKNRGAGKDQGRDKERAPSKRRSRQERALAMGSLGCCSSGTCTPGPGKNLFKCCYQGQNLTGKNFSGANLGSANFSDATLTGANLQGANLGQACLVDAVLAGAKINSATNLGGVIYCRTQTDSGENNSGCAKGTSCCPTCDDDNPCGDGQLCCKGRCVPGDCCATANCPNKTCQTKTCQGNRCAYTPVHGRSGPDCQGMCCQDAEGAPACCPAGVTACQPNGRCGCRAGDCARGEVCCGGICVAGECCAETDCPAKVCEQRACTGNRCVYTPVSGSKGQDCDTVCCRNASGQPVCCAAGVTVCQPDGACGCASHQECGPDRRCCGGRCVAGVCCAAADCPDVACMVDKRCDGNQCRYGDAGNGTACTGADNRPGICCGGQCVAGGQCCAAGDCPDETCRAKSCVGHRCEQAVQQNGPGTRCFGQGQTCCGGPCCIGPAVCDTRPEQDACCTPPDRNRTCGAGTDNPRCGAVTDDCGQTVECDACAERTCQDGVCDESDHMCDYTPVGDGRQGPGCRGDGQFCCNDSRCCASGQVCTGDGCCTPDENVCQGKCGVVTDNCERQVDCGACAPVTCRTVACAGNACQIAGSQPDKTGCTTAGGQSGVCCGGECVAGTCCANADCTDPAAPICRDNVCSACTADGQCGPNRTCCNGRCGTGGCCATNDQCGAGRVCCDGRCRAGTCCTNAECRVPGTGGGVQVCRDNVCRPCTAHAECGPDHLCDLGDDPDRLGTCHVCDVLSDSQTDLLDVLERANSGQTIYICPGIHRFGGPAAIMDVPDLTLYGAGSGGDPEVDTILVPQLIGIANRRDDAKVMHLSISGGLEGSTVINGSNASLTLQDVALAGGRADSGGCVQNAGDLTLRDVTLSRCQATSLGGGIVNNGHLTIEDVIIADCTAGEGGGIAFRGNPSAVASGTLERLTISRCVATGDGGGISGEIDGEVTLISSSIVACEAAGDGGGIRILVGGVLRLVGSSVSECTAEGEGGGIFNDGFDPDNTEDPPDPDNPPDPEPPDPEPRLILDLSVVSGCTAGGRGGGIFNDGLMILRNETEIRDNRSATEPEGQGIYNQGTITCETVTPPPNSDITVNPRVCGNPGNAAATLATNCRNTGSSCNNPSRPVCLGDAAPGSGTCSPACTADAECRFGPCCDGFCVRFGDCCADADCPDPNFPTCIDNICAACTVDGQCGAGRVCCGDGVCRECCDMGDCPLSARRCCDGVCKGCCDSLDCPLNRPICTAEEICVACQSDGQCVAAGRGDRCCNGQCRTGAC